MQFELFILLTTVILTMILGLIVLLRNPKSAESISFFALCLSLSIWVISNYYTDHSNTTFLNLSLARADYLFGILIVDSIVLVCENFGNQKGFSRRSLVTFFSILAIFGAFSITPLVVSSTTHVNNATIVNPGTLYFLYPIIALSVLGYGLFRLWRNRKKSDSRVFKTQAAFLFFALLLSFPLGIFLAVVLPALIDNPLVVKIGPLAILVMVLPVSFAIVKHKLFDIRAVAARSVTYVLTIGLIGGVYGFLAFRVVNIFLQGASVVSQEAVYTILAIVLAFLFQPIRRFFQKISNAIFYRGKYDPQQLINEIGRILAGEIQLDQLSHKVIRELGKQMKISSVDIVVLSEKSVHFQTRVFSSERHEIIVSDLKKLGRLMVVADDIAAGEKKQIMQKYGFSVSLALRTSEEFLGYLLLGEKKSGDIYNDEDLRTLKIIANELSVGLQNAKAFAEIQAFNVTLQQKVNQATKSLRHANDQLKELDKAKDEFISMASHQLRTPLTTVKGYVSMLDEGDFGKISKAQREPIEQVLDGSNRMARLIDDLLNVSRMEAGRFFIDATEIDLNKIVPQEIDQLQSLAKSKKVELVYKAPAKPIPTMHLDENKTRQVIMNLADNAVHYSQPPKGGGKVEVRLERDGDDIVYAVRDNGIGVPKDQQDKLFTKMFRARNAQELRPDGTGLGLYLVKRVIEDQGGKIVFESEPGRGSMFGFRMPIHNKVVVDKKAQKALAEAHKNG